MAPRATSRALRSLVRRLTGDVLAWFGLDDRGDDASMSDRPSPQQQAEMQQAAEQPQQEQQAPDQGQQEAADQPQQAQQEPDQQQQPSDDNPQGQGGYEPAVGEPGYVPPESQRQE